MKTETSKRIAIKIAPQEQQENVRNTRKTLKDLQHTAADKENLVGRSRQEKDVKLSEVGKNEAKRKKMSNKGVQTGESVITEQDLTSDEPSADYWKLLAEKRGDALNDSFKEIERLKEQVDDLKEENKVCKEMLDESKHLVEVLQEILEEQNTSTETVDETKED